MIMSKQRFHKIFRSALIVFMVSVLMLGSAISVCAAAEYPKPDKNVADDAGVLSESTIRSIQKTNETLSKEVGATIAICTVSTTGEEDIATYARNIFKEAGKFGNLNRNTIGQQVIPDRCYRIFQNRTEDFCVFLIL